MVITEPYVTTLIAQFTTQPRRSYNFTTEVTGTKKGDMVIFSMSGTLISYMECGKEFDSGTSFCTITGSLPATINGTFVANEKSVQLFIQTLSKENLKINNVLK